MIEFREVTYKYKNKTALHKVSLNIKEGESIALIGPNGSGKSTFLKLINGIVNPSEGSYFFQGEEISEKKLNDNKFSKLFHKQIGFVFQNSDTQLFCSTVYEEIAFGPRQMGLSENEVNIRVKDCLKLLEIDKIKHEAPYNLSGGEKKRVAIACVLSMNPDVLTFDEPMNGIDPRGKRFLRELMIKLNNAGKTIICSTHDFEYVKGVFKRTLVFSEDNKLIKDDAFENIMMDEDFLINNNLK